MGELKRVRLEIDTRFEMTEICDRVLRAGGPAILFESPKGHAMPVLGNLFGTPRRVALGMGQESVDALREVGKLLAFLKEPEPPRGAEGCVGEASRLQAGTEHVAEDRLVGAVSGDRSGKARMSTCRACRSSIAGRATWRR